jgi:biopolymer transport protein ExbD
VKLKNRTVKKPRIEMLPLIDIVFLLLVVFIYAMLSMAVHRGLPVRLPSSQAAETKQADTLAVTARKERDGTLLLFVDKEPVAASDLVEVLRERAARPAGKGDGRPGVLLFADRDVAYQQLFTVLDAIRAAGLSDVSLQAEGEGGR